MSLKLTAEQADMDLTAKHEGDITVTLPPKLRALVGERVGLLRLKRHLEETKEDARSLLGFRYAYALVVNQFAEVELRLARAMLTEATKQGINISTHQAAHFTMDGDVVFRAMELIPPDLREGEVVDL